MRHVYVEEQMSPYTSLVNQFLSGKSQYTQPLLQEIAIRFLYPSFWSPDVVTFFPSADMTMWQLSHKGYIWWI